MFYTIRKQEEKGRREEKELEEVRLRERPVLSKTNFFLTLRMYKMFINLSQMTKYGNLRGAHKLGNR